MKRSEEVRIMARSLAAAGVEITEPVNMAIQLGLSRIRAVKYQENKARKKGITKGR